MKGGQLAFNVQYGDDSPRLRWRIGVQANKSRDVIKVQPFFLFSIRETCDFEVSRVVLYGSCK